MEISLESFHDPQPPHWLSGAPWRWEIRTQNGWVLADGEGCRTPAVAIEKARIVALQEGWLK